MKKEIVFWDAKALEGFMKHPDSGVETVTYYPKRKKGEKSKVRKPINPLNLSENESPDYYLDKMREDEEEDGCGPGCEYPKCNCVSGYCSSCHGSGAGSTPDERCSACKGSGSNKNEIG